jgi:hypothetical protein
MEVIKMDCNKDRIITIIESSLLLLRDKGYLKKNSVIEVIKQIYDKMDEADKINKGEQQ